MTYQGSVQGRLLPGGELDVVDVVLPQLEEATVHTQQTFLSINRHMHVVCVHLLGGLQLGLSSHKYLSVGAVRRFTYSGVTSYILGL